MAIAFYTSVTCGRLRRFAYEGQKDNLLREIVNQVCVAYCYNETELKSPSQSRILSEARAVVGWLAQESGCVTLSEVGRIVSRDVGSISSAVRRLSDRMRDEPELAEKVKLLKVAFQTT